MERFEPGDVVIYEHVKAGDPRRNGSLGIVKEIDPIYSGIGVEWLFLSYKSKYAVYYTHPYNLQKIGHVDAT